MDGAIRRLAGKVLHSKPTLFVRSRLNRLIFHGRSYECPICGAKLRKYLPYGRRNALLERMRSAAVSEVKAASYPLNLVLTEKPGKLNEAQKQALLAAQEALHRLTRAAEKTVPSESLSIKK